MTEIERIVDQVRKSFEGDAWHGPSVMEVLAGVTAETAHARLVAGCHTIAELVLHLSATEDLLLGRIAGSTGAVDESAYWLTPADERESTWQAILAELRQRHAALLAAIVAFDANKLDEPLFVGGSPAFNNFVGHAQHNTYHAGQIALLKSMAALA